MKHTIHPIMNTKTAYITATRTMKNGEIIPGSANIVLQRTNEPPAGFAVSQDSKAHLEVQEDRNGYRYHSLVVDNNVIYILWADHLALESRSGKNGLILYLTEILEAVEDVIGQL